MDGAGDDDPFFWDVAAVARVLAAPNQPWTRDPDALAYRIQEEEVDGKTLLTFEHVCSREELMQCLGIRLARHKAAIGENILTLRSKSWEYQRWMEEYNRKKSGFYLDSAGPKKSATPNLGVDPTLPQSQPIETGFGEAAQHQTNGDESLPSPKPTVLHDETLDPEISQPFQSDKSAKQVRSSCKYCGFKHVPENEPDHWKNCFYVLPGLVQTPERFQTMNHRLQKVVEQLIWEDPKLVEDIEAWKKANNYKEPEGLPWAALSTTISPSHETDEPQLGPELESSHKRKRIAPVTVASKPLNVAQAFIPTEADTISFAPGNDQEHHQFNPWEEASPDAYLGGGSLTLAAIKSPSGSLSSRLIEPTEDSFATVVPNWFPPGRRLAVNRGMKRLLRQNSRREMLQNHGIFLMRSPTPSDSDSILDLVDLADDFDEETAAEMEEEKLDQERHDSHIAQRSLAPERVEQVLMSAIDAMKMTWQETKLPKYQRKAYRLWHAAQRGGTRTNQVLAAHQQAKSYDERIKKLCARIMEQVWNKEDEISFQARSLEQSIHDKLYSGWLVEMLGSRTEPPKPQGILKPKPNVTRNQREDLAGEEILTSSDEDDFIVPDDEPGAGNGDPMDLDGGVNYESLGRPAESVKAESPEFLDLTQSAWGPSSPTSPMKTAFIDLTSPAKPDCPSPRVAPSEINTTPTKPEFPAPMPSIESLGSFDEIGALTPTHWAKARDRWKLLVCLIWKLPHNRRSALLEFIQASSIDDAWKETVQAQIADSLKDLLLLRMQSPKTLAFDVTRIYISFARTRYFPETRLVPFTPKLQHKIEKIDRSWFHMLCSFVKAAAHQFPQDSQIYRAESPENALEEDIDDDDDLPHDGDNSPSKRRRAAPKEIIQNKDAVDMREREVNRVQILEARKLKLRADLASSGLMSRDRTRLIINESKQDDQSFIYINEDISRRIKEHQVDGVRFMWNQVVLDAQTARQGCLLAHTMGLGKTMQVITLLVAIQESASSSDPSVRAQVPEDLQRSQTLVLCPPGLVDNWIDELLMWTPKDALGPLRRVDALMGQDERTRTVQEWSRTGGVIVMGYRMLGLILAQHTVEDLILDKPNIVIADEAHHMKNEKSMVHKSCARFRTLSRIALTGSPLANNVEEYRAMMDWVAPNFLGPLTEFREMYATPIQHGLYHDSTGPEKRSALKKLEALKATVAPKVHRATINSCLKDDLPPKFEFVISVSPTPLQSKLYALYLQGLEDKGIGPDGSKLQQSQLFTVTNHLALICNHPRCFQHKVKQISEGNLEDEDDSGKEDSTFPTSIIQPVLKELKVPDPDLASLSRKVELLTVILDEAREMGDKVLVFSQALMAIDYLLNLFKMQKRRVSYLTGKTPISKRQEMIKNFNMGKQEVYLISTTAGGVGLNIQGANRVVIFDIKWNPVQEQQAIGRAYRIGQEKPVFVYRFVVAGTFEEELQNKHVFKTQLASRVVDKKNPISWSKRKGIVLHPIRSTPAKDLTPFLGKDRILDKLIRYKKDGAAIRSILSTDTFEEEDLDVKLSADELQDVKSMVEMNRLMFTDPDGYQRAKQKLGQEEFYRLSQLSHALPASEAGTVALRPHAPVNQSLDGTFDAPDPVTMGQDLYPHRPSMTSAVNETSRASHLGSQVQHPSIASGAAPLPVAGANTYFGAPAMAPAPAPSPATTQTVMHRLPPKPTQSTHYVGGNIFTQPQSQSKMNFHTRLASRIKELQQHGLRGTSEGAQKFAESVTDEINSVRERLQLGFLPDNQHWKHLEELLAHDRFVTSLVSGHLTASYVAIAEKKVLESRLHAMNGLPEKEISAQASRRVHSPDPQNLQNIGRQVKVGGTSNSPHAREDMEVMWEAADNRKRRDFRLPTWANRALFEEQGRAFPAAGTIDPTRDRRLESSKESPRRD
ncbi:hypothetical protein AK830_g5048 [Neonectria ditissima]|uniref:Protein CHROMATIN REMODELING 20 n=1 Tax=Neonectria ditissima TaxID=78410 RepID=A0A0N8H7E6_9HYPO|nr:hypothetical protein AK830_g5048 [Neonectria ditissima]